jgi:tRNA A37 threonylcarbamoyladenosine dehydratase
MVREQLTKVLNMRISPTEFEMLEKLSETEGLPMAAIIRQLVRKEFAAKHGDAPVKGSRTKKR